MKRTDSVLMAMIVLFSLLLTACANRQALTGVSIYKQAMKAHHLNDTQLQILPDDQLCAAYGLKTNNCLLSEIKRRKLMSSQDWQYLGQNILKARMSQCAVLIGVHGRQACELVKRQQAKIKGKMEVVTDIHCNDYDVYTQNAKVIGIQHASFAGGMSPTIL